MTDRAKQIEEMAIGVCEYRKARGYKKCDDCDWGGECGVTEYAREFYDAGYRKQSEVVKEFAGRLKERFEKTSTMATALHGRKESEITSIIDTVAAEYGVEVEK